MAVFGSVEGDDWRSKPERYDFRNIARDCWSAGGYSDFSGVCVY